MAQVNMNLEIITFNGDLDLTVHIGNLETTMTICHEELSSKHKEQIMAIMNEHIAEMNTTAILTKLTK